jgi:hypothetical protein
MPETMEPADSGLKLLTMNHELFFLRYLSQSIKMIIITFERHKLPKPTQEEIDNLSSLFLLKKLNS